MEDKARTYKGVRFLSTAEVMWRRMRHDHCRELQTYLWRTKTETGQYSRKPYEEKLQDNILTELYVESTCWRKSWEISGQQKNFVEGGCVQQHLTTLVCTDTGPVVTTDNHEKLHGNRECLTKAGLFIRIKLYFSVDNCYWIKSRERLVGRLRSLIFDEILCQ